MKRFDLDYLIDIFSDLGKIISKNIDILSVGQENSWFTEDNIRFALNELSESLKKENLIKWTSKYPELKIPRKSKRILTVMAGNIPLVGFHDFLSILISGNIFVGKMSSKDDKIFPRILKYLYETDDRFKERIFLTDEIVKDFDAVIATGSNNSARYFEYYFGKYPNIIRKNRNSAAILTGNESKEELKLLSDDIFRYFGLGCRNVSKLFLPKNYDLNNIFENCEKYKNIINHNKYSNNYGYNRSIYLMNNITFWDNNFLLLREESSYSSPVSVLYFENYSDINEIKDRISIDNDKIQCVVSQKNIIEGSIYFGDTQKPKLWDYADNKDILKFLLNL